MKKTIFISFIFLIFFNISSFAQSPEGKKFGFGIILGDPLGGTVKVWTKQNNAFVFDLGKSYFGSPRIDVDYLWHFDAFQSKIANLYAGPGGVIGIGEGNGVYYKNKFVRKSSDVGIGARGIFGVNIIPERTPLEFFFEVGVLLGFSPEFDSFFDAALGMRFYP